MKDVSVFYNSSHSAQGYCGYDAAKNYIVVAFRGSDDIVNWINNFDFV
jgi:hypothetical protein